MILSWEKATSGTGTFDWEDNTKIIAIQASASRRAPRWLSCPKTPKLAIDSTVQPV